MDISKRKFAELPLKAQHRHLARLLRSIYEELIYYKEDPQKQLLYTDLCALSCQWKGIDYRQKHLVAHRYHRHLAAANHLVREPDFLPTVRKGDRAQSEPLLPISIYLDHLRSAHNVGSILRTVEAFALGSIHFSPQTPDIEHLQVRKTAMGTADRVMTGQNTLLSDLPRPWIALETSQKALSLHEFIFPLPMTLIVGNEEYGCSPEIIQQADFLVEIPLWGYKNSLNVANAFAIAAAEIRRQWGANRDL